MACTNDWPDDTDGKEEGGRKGEGEAGNKARRDPGPWGASLHASLPHEFWGFKGGFWKCRRCSRSTKGLGEPKAFARERCKGSLAGKAHLVAGGHEEEAFQRFNHSEEEFAAKGGRREEAWGAEEEENAGSTAVFETVRSKWFEAKNKRKEVEPPHCTPRHSTGGESQRA